MNLRRREFLSRMAIVGSVAAAGPLLSAPNGSRPPVGEPYELAGRRLYFLNWYYIRPGSFTWKDEQDRPVGLTAAVEAGAAYLTHTDQPIGIRLVAQRGERLGPLIEGDRPWEDNAGVALTTIIKDGGVFRGWGGPFTTSGNPPGQKHFYYLESTDGLT